MSLQTAQPTIIACGGTIESHRNPDGTKEITGGIESWVPEGEVVRFRMTASFELRLADMLELASVVRSQSQEVPVIVTCGTDTLEDVAFVLDCLAPPAGVLITGAAIGGGRGEDGPTNLEGARIAALDAKRPRQTAIVAFAGIYRRGRSVEESAAPPDLFSASPSEQAGYWDATGAWWTHGARAIGLPWPSEAPVSVGVLMAHPAAVPSTAAIDEPDILVVGGYGAGNFPPSFSKPLLRRLKAGRPVVVTSRAPAIPVAMVSRQPGGGAELLQNGAWNAGRLNPRKAGLLAALVAHAKNPIEQFETTVQTLSSELDA